MAKTSCVEKRIAAILSESGQRSLPSSRTVTFLVIATLGTLFGSVLLNPLSGNDRAIAIAQDSAASETADGVPSVPAVSLVGTWRADNGSIFQLRADGTARSRDATAKVPDVGYFDWNSDGTTLTWHYVPRGLILNFIAHQFDHETADISIVELTVDTLIVDYSGTQTQLVRTTDALLDRAP